LDRDEDALKLAGERLKGFGARAELAHANFAEMGRVARERGRGPFRGILLDLGVSSMQLDRGERGFSFRAEAPLDMRMDRSGGRTAAELLEEEGEEELAQIFREYGEEPAAPRVAREIARTREAGRCPKTTTELAELVEKAKGGRRGKIHPATLVFQALRIAVNGELEALERALPQALELLESGGRLAVISFHSLEDRMVKRFMAAHEGRMESLMAGGERWCGVEPRGKRLGRKPTEAGDDETARNPRARTAKLRVFERM
jgi:16S rRNA (cytosine1402-N4)-methyltransferase